MESGYRICPERGSVVQKLHKGNWLDAYYCTNPEAAKVCLERCIKRAAEWALMTDDERMKAILR